MSMTGEQLMYDCGQREAEAGEPLYVWDDDPHYAKGWCAFHGCENPYTSAETLPEGTEK